MDRSRLPSSIVSLFSNKANFLQDRLSTLGDGLKKAKNLATVGSILREAIQQAVSPVHCHVYLEQSGNNGFAATPDQNGHLTSDLRFAPDSPLVTYLHTRTSPVVIETKALLPPALEVERSRLTLLKPHFIFPLNGMTRLLGWVMVGTKGNARSYHPQEIKSISLLCDFASLGIERLSGALQAEDRAQEINTLVEISQGVNITLQFDDALEFIYSRINQVIPTQDFQISMYDDRISACRFVFYLEGDTRCAERENQPLGPAQGLDYEVFRSQTAILTADYQQECRQRTLTPATSEISAWMGVPLHAGSETIGVLALGSRNPTERYSDHQLNFLQAIADQAAGAMVKTRLLLEAQERARQLSILNEAARTFSSTFELPTLVQSILQNAMYLLGFKSGSLVLSESPTATFITKAVAGSVSTGLAGKPPLIDPVLIDEVLKTKHICSSQTELLVPLLAKESVVGIICLSERPANLKISPDEQALLAIYTSQATSSLEMAQSYEKTDLALAARVEELSVMQQIDRELNTSLEIDKAMQITLDWAMRQSRADAGLIGLVEDEGVQVMSSQGYTNELAPFLNALIPSDALLIGIGSPTDLPDSLRLSSNPDSQTGLLANGHSQVLIPIRREANVIGIILLECRQPEFWSEENLAFLTRLSDHASVAIFNAQLYHVVQDANNAKSEFVSFVSHELKNPMTSIKGYTELLAAGAVGPVTGPQANFLSTIRSNIDRMNTLISDLNDLSKIEAGRLRLEFKAFSISDGVEEAVRSARRQIDEKNQSLSIEISPDLPFIWADRTRVIQVLVNLISNANKYTPQGGQILVSAEVGVEPERAPDSAKTIHLAVKDNGIGIAEDDQRKIFQKFFRSEDPKTRETSGTGLGLNITRSLVEMQGGRIWFESLFRQGTTFHITLPIAG